MEVDDYINRVEGLFKNVDLPPEMDGNLFNFMSSNEIAEYVEKRFGIGTNEVIRTYFVY